MDTKVELLNIVKEKVFKVILKNLKVEEAKLSENSHFVNDLDADSLDQVELVMAIEEEFGCEIKEEQAEKFTTVGSLIDYLVQEAKNGKCSKVS